jgi:hypothetical protein
MCTAYSFFFLDQVSPGWLNCAGIAGISALHPVHPLRLRNLDCLAIALCNQYLPAHRSGCLCSIALRSVLQYPDIESSRRHCTFSRWLSLDGARGVGSPLGLSMPANVQMSYAQLRSWAHPCPTLSLTRSIPLTLRSSTL